MQRACDGCTKCCEGWLAGTIHGKNMFPGRPCHFMGKAGCTIYADRPENPCKTFECEWLTNPELPEWAKPAQCNAIIHRKTWRDAQGVLRWYYNIVEAGEPLRSSVLSLMIQHCLINRSDLRYEIEGGSNWIGSPEFVEHMTSR